MTDPDYAVVRLTEVHVVWLEGRTAECDPLLEQLRAARYSSVGRGSGGGGSGSLLNQKAIDAYETIDGRVRGWLDHFGQESRGDLNELVPRLLQIIRAEIAGDRLSDDDGERLLGMFDATVNQIEDVLDPPHEKELLAPCPSCGERYEVSVSEQRHVTQAAAVRIPVKAGRPIVAACHCCGTTWESVDELRALAIGMGIDVDLAALAAALETTP